MKTVYAATAALAVSVAICATPAIAQDAVSIAPAPATANAAQPVQAVRAAAAPAAMLPAGTEIPLRMTQLVTTKGKGWEEGDQFNLAVASDIMLGDFIVIPEGTKGVGRITWLTSRGAFGKSGKMDIELEHLELDGRRIAIDGSYRQEGDGATLATVGGVLLAGVFAGFITGKSGSIPQGRELMATLESNLPVALPAGATTAPVAVQARAVAPVQADAQDEAARVADPAIGDTVEEPATGSTATIVLPGE